MEKTSAEGVFLDLARSILNGTKPSELPDDVTADEVFAIGSRQDMAPITFCALNSISPKPESEKWGEWQKRFLDDCMRSEIQLSEYRRLTEYLCGNGVKIIPLKGVVIKDLYPSPSLRVMSDVDLLYNGIQTRNLSKLMKAFGYSAKDLEAGYHDVFYKKPCMNIELHRQLEEYNSPYKSILNDMFDRATEDAEVPNLYHIKPEDLYIHVIVHAAKHFKLSGLGIRPIADIYVIYSKFSENWDFGYISSQLQSVGLERFEEKIRKTAVSFFGEEHSEISDAELMFFFRGGTYGKYDESVRWESISSGECRKDAILRKIFAPMSDMKNWFPVLKKHPYLYPFIMVFRWFDRLLHRTRRVKAVFTLDRIPKEEIEYEKSILKDFGMEEKDM